MATLEINGRRIQVDDSFRSLSPEDQQKTVDEIAGSLGAAPEPAAPTDYRGEGGGRGSGLEAALIGARQGVTFGFGDEMNAGVRAAGDWLGGEEFGKSYDKRLEHERGLLHQTQQENPYSEFAGEIGGSALLPGGILKKAGATVAKNALRFGVGGALQGLIYGYGSGEGGIAQRAGSAAVGGALGGATGAAAPYVLKGAQNIVNNRATRRAITEAGKSVNPETTKAASRALYKSIGARELEFSDDATGQLLGKLNEALSGFDEDTAAVTLRKVGRLAEKSKGVSPAIPVKAAPKVAAEAAPKRPQTLLEALQEVGVKDPGDDLASMGVKDWDGAQKFKRNALRNDGLDQDQAARWLWERGFLDDQPEAAAMRAADAGQAPEPDLVRAMHRAIDDELGGEPHFSAQDYGAADEWRAFHEDGGHVPTPDAAPGFGGIEDGVAPKGGGLSLTSLMNTRDALSKQSMNKMSSDGAAAATAVGEIDKFVDNLVDFDAKSGDVEGLGADWKEARKLWKQFRNSEKLQTAITNAGDVASGFENGLRIEFRKLLRDKKSNLSDAEKQVIREVVRGSTMGNLMRRLAGWGGGEGQQRNLLNMTTGMGAGFAAGHAVAGLPGGIVGAGAVLGAGKLAARGSQGATEEAAQRALGFVANGGRYQQPPPQMLPGFGNALRLGARGAAPAGVNLWNR